MTETATTPDATLTLTQRELELIVSWWSWAYGEGATNEADDILAGRIAAKARGNAAG